MSLSAVANVQRLYASAQTDLSRDLIMHTHEYVMNKRLEPSMPSVSLPGLTD